ncbi:MAG TPA: glycosyltransferase family 2 protein [Candidatus Nanoarchaeia archaeon]|nr:glycosyltransferase family 2 protein [Candidatus Nanoarchaeia archaeon]
MTEETSALENAAIINLHGLSVVVGIPAFNEEKTIARVVLEAQKYAHVVAVCDDGSSDLTGEIAERLGAVVVRHEHNSGYGAALQSLFSRARELNADVLVTLDGDGQHNPAEIPQLVKPIENGVADVVLGSRFIDKNGTAEMSLYRQLGVKVITKLANGGKNGVSDSQSGFRAYNKLAMENLACLSENGMSASIELLRQINKAGLSICEVPVSCKYAETVGARTSSKNSISHGLSLVMSLVKLVVEDRPLVYLGIPGIFFLAAGALFGVWMLELYASTDAIVTNVALAAVAFVLVGFFMLTTAVTLYAISKLSNKIYVNSKRISKLEND